MVKQPITRCLVLHSYNTRCAKKRVSTMKQSPAELRNGFACNFLVCSLSRAIIVPFRSAADDCQRILPLTAPRWLHCTAVHCTCECSECSCFLNLNHIHCWIEWLAGWRGGGGDSVGWMMTQPGNQPLAPRVPAPAPAPAPAPHRNLNLNPNPFHLNRILHSISI